MKPYKVNRPLLRIEWEDHVGYNGTWTNYKDVDNTPITIVSVGYLIAEDKTCLSLCSCIDTQDGKTGKNISTIIKSCITSRKQLKDVN